MKIKKIFKLEYIYEDGSTEEYFCQEKNITLAKKKLFSILKKDRKELNIIQNNFKIYEYIKGVGWKEK